MKIIIISLLLMFSLMSVSLFTEQNAYAEAIPETIKQFVIAWLVDKISDGELIDAIQKYVDVKLIDIPFEINDENILKIDIPDWVKNVTYWWIQEKISDKEFAEVINYLINENIIYLPIEGLK